MIQDERKLGTKPLPEVKIRPSTTQRVRKSQYMNWNRSHVNPDSYRDYVAAGLSVRYNELVVGVVLRTESGFRDDFRCFFDDSVSL